MANKKIFDLPASGALVNTTLVETQLTANGQSQKVTLAQVLDFIQKAPFVQVSGTDSDRLIWAAAGVTPDHWIIQNSASASGPWVDFSTQAGNDVSGISGAMFYRVTGYNAGNVAITPVSNVAFAP